MNYRRRASLVTGIVLLLALNSLAGARTAGATEEQSSGAVVVSQPYGAAIHISPDSDAGIYENVSCGVVLNVYGSLQGWYQVQTRDGIVGWIGAARVTDATRAGRFDCTIYDPYDGPSGYTVQVGYNMYSYVQSGCLSLRDSPSRTAPYDYCVSNFHRYTVTGGPIEIAGEDWLQVYSDSTGEGWSLAQFLTIDCGPVC